MVARIILIIADEHIIPLDRKTYILLFIVSRVGNDVRIKSAGDLIATLNNDTMFIRIHEFVIQENLPLRMQHFTSTVRYKMVAGPCSFHVLTSKVLERVRKL